jgi:4-hydroxy-tetrahydrodipicolinate synthase
MTSEKIQGSFVALITPFNRDGSIDFEGFRTLLQFQEENGTSAILFMGSTGETSLLNPEERRSIVTETMKFYNGRMPFYYGCSGNSTEAAIENVRHAAGEGADGAILAVPSYICPSEEDSIQYFLDIADASSIPIGIYNNPPRVKTDLSAQAVLKLAEHPNIVINKESTSRVAQISHLCAARPDFSLMCCDSPTLGLVVPLMALGGDGTANMSGNVIPREMAVISKPWQDYDDAVNCRETWLRMLPMLHFTYSAINPVAVKSLMRALGLPAGGFRRPLTGLDEASLQVGLDIARDLGLMESYGFNAAIAAE